MQVLCVHGDTLFYPTATVELRIGPWQERSRVIVAPNLPVDVLLGNDISEFKIAVFFLTRKLG